MAILIGTDEAGYGPNLGPLIISATVWQVPDELAGTDLFELLGEVVSPVPHPECLAIADSKKLYKPGAGLGVLERSVLAALYGATGKMVSRWYDVWPLLAPADVPYLAEVPWYAAYDASLPCDARRDDVAWLGARFADGLGNSGVSLNQIRAAAVFPACFNRLLQRHGSKGAALSHLTLDLLRQVLEASGCARTLVRCDKHGGRNRYGPLLQASFPEYLVEVVHEARDQSVYRWGPRTRRIEVRFVAQGESFLPAALASMTSKYLRELAMQAFNAFWKARLPDLRPTAGYPVDAKRFRKEIQGTQAELGIDDRILWRNK